MATGHMSAIPALVITLVLLIPDAFPARQALPMTRDDCGPPLVTTDERASEILAEERPFDLTNEDILYTYRHPDWDDAEPLRELEGPAPSEEAVNDELLAFLERRFPCEPDRVQEGMAVYSDPVAREKIPDPTLRAALAALTGTVGEPAIRFLLYETPVTSVRFGVPLDAGTVPQLRPAMTYASPDGTHDIVIDLRFRFAPFAAFSALLAHEALHTGVDDDAAGLPEEAVAIAIEALVYMGMLLTEPELATLPDRLTRFNNNRLAIARLNSGIEGTDDLNLFVPGSAVNIDPVAVEPVTEFYEYYAANESVVDPEFRDRETEGNGLLQEILALLAEPGEEPPSNADFDEETVEFVDQNQSILSPAELITVACILELDVPCDEPLARSPSGHGGSLHSCRDSGRLPGTHAANGTWGGQRVEPDACQPGGESMGGGAQ